MTELNRPLRQSAGVSLATGALREMELAYEERSNWLTLLKVDPKVDGLRTDPRFAGLLQRVAPAV